MANLAQRIETCHYAIEARAEEVYRESNGDMGYGFDMAIDRIVEEELASYGLTRRYNYEVGFYEYSEAV